MRLLIAEDEQDLAEALTAFFEKNQFTVDAVHDGMTAYDYAVTGGYDAVILDILMPKMDGIQVLKRLREDGVSVPIMMLTAKAEKDDRVVGFDAGADDYLPKPFSPDELLARSGQCCAARGTTSPPSSNSAISPWTAEQGRSGAETGRNG